MADAKISELTNLPVASSDDEFAIVDKDVAETKKITFSNIMASPGPIGTTNSDSAVFTALQFDSGGANVTRFSTNTDLGNSDTIVPTQNAVKTYVDANTRGENVRRVSSDTTAVVNDVLLVDTTNGNVTIEMLDSSDGRIVIKKISNDSNSVIVTTSGSSTIDGQAQFTIATPYQSYNFLVDSGEFFVI